MPNPNSLTIQSLDLTKLNSSDLGLDPSLLEGLGGSVLGEYVTKDKGFGFEPYGHRPYELGDDVRTIDHRASARIPGSGLVVKETYKDVTPNLWVVSDSPSLDYESGPLGYFSIRELGRGVVGALSVLARENRIKMGVVLASQSGLYPKTKKELNSLSPNKLVDVYDSLSGNTTFEPDNLNRLDELLSYLGRVVSEKLVIVVSALDSKDWKNKMNSIKANNNLVSIRLVSPSRYELPTSIDAIGSPYRGRVNLGNFSQRSLLAIRREYRRLAEEEDKITEQFLTTNRIPHFDLRTDSKTWFKDLIGGLTNLQKNQ